MKRPVLVSIASLMAVSGLVLLAACDGGGGGGGTLPEVLCGDGLDNDGDTLVDCADADCAGTPACTETNCGDGLDDDGDTLIDCADPDCGVDDDLDTFSECQGDCDDTNAAIFPGAVEACNGVDDDCVRGVPAAEADDDGDGFRVCAGDCDDASSAINPAAQEVCDAVDNDCDTLVDSLDPSNIGTATWYDDDDGDGFGDATDSLVQCDQPVGYVANDDDCDDADATINPNTIEECDDDDDNCDGVVDNGCDDDGDDFCDDDLTTAGGPAPAVCPSGDGDCDDANAAINPDEVEICNSVDDDCDGAIDEGCDDDGDTYCDSAMIVVGFPTSCTSGGGDCDDSGPGASDVNPGATEICTDTDDNNCDGFTDCGDPVSCPPCTTCGNGNKVCSDVPVDAGLCKPSGQTTCP
jgi:hypothetical protein